MKIYLEGDESEFILLNPIQIRPFLIVLLLSSDDVKIFCLREANYTVTIKFRCIEAEKIKKEIKKKTKARK